MLSNDKPRVLITGAGGAAACVLLSHLSPHARLHAADIDPLAAGLYLAREGRRHLIPRGDDARLVPVLLRLCKEHRIDVLVPTVDFELLAVSQARAEFEAIGTQLMVASPETLEVCLDKLALCRRLELIAPRSVPLDGDFDPTDWMYPILVKPRTGAGGRGIRVVESAKDMRALIGAPGDMVQEYLPGEEYSVDVLRLGREVLATVPRARLKVDSGVAVAARTVHDLVVEAAARYAAEAIDLEGVANVQLRRSRGGTPKLMEINARFPGTMSITIAAGADLPMAWLEYMLSGRLPAPIAFRDVAMVRTWQDHVIDAFVREADPGAEADAA